MSVENVDARLVGIIGKAHGIKGELIVRLFTDYPKSIYRGTCLFLDRSCTKKVIIEDIHFKDASSKNTAFIKFSEFSTRSQAESLRGFELYRQAGDIPSLEEGRYWSDDLKGCIVCSSEGTPLGEVVKVENFTSNSNITVKKIRSDIDIKGVSGDFFYIPLISDYIEKIDMDRKKIILKRIPEFI